MIPTIKFYIYTSIFLIILGIGVYFIGMPLLDNPKISCPNTGIDKFGNGCSTSFGFFATIMVLILSVGIAIIYDKNRRF